MWVCGCGCVHVNVCTYVRCIHKNALIGTHTHAHTHTHTHTHTHVYMRTFFPTGQFWHLQFHQEEFTGEFNRGGTREGTVQITTPSDLGSRSFISLHHPLTWDRREETCYYAGSKQAGATDYIPAPEDTIIEGGYTDYMVDHNFDTEFTFSVFSSEDFGCPSTSSLLTRSIQ